MMTVTSGRKCSESYVKSGPLGCLVRTCLESSIWHSTRCLLTWKTKATKAKRSLFQLAALTPRTEETGSLFWPTPTSTGAALSGGTGNYKTLLAMERRGLISEEERRSFANGNGGKTNPALLEWLMGYEQKFTELIPTPRASDANGAAMNSWYSQTVQVERERGKYHGKLNELVQVTPLGRLGPLNPEWVEWLMGFPIGWTELDASETR